MNGPISAPKTYRRWWSGLAAVPLALGLVAGCGGGSSAGSDAEYVRWCATLAEVDRTSQLISERSLLLLDDLMAKLIENSPDSVKTASEAYAEIQTWMNAEIRSKMSIEGERQFAMLWSDSRQRFGLEATLISLLDASEAEAQQINETAIKLSAVVSDRCK